MAQQATTPESYSSQEIPTSTKFNQLVEAAKQAMVVAKGEIAIADINTYNTKSLCGVYLVKVNTHIYNILQVTSDYSNNVYQTLTTVATDPNSSYLTSRGNLAIWTRTYVSGAWSAWSNPLLDKADKPFVVSINGTTKAADKVFAEIKEAYNAGKKVEFYVDEYTWDEGGSSGIDVISFKVDAVYVEYYTSQTGRFNAHTYVSYVGNDGATHYGHIFVEMKQDGTVNIVAKSDN